MENSLFKLSDDGWIHLSSKGEQPWKSADGSEKVLQVIDEQAIEAMVKNFEPEMLVDYDHESHDPSKRTTAAGWITKVEARADGLWGQVRWSEKGWENVKGGHYRFVSPTFDMNNSESLGDRSGMKAIRPLKLADAALTNRPNLHGMVPLTNRAVLDSNDVANQPQQKDMLCKIDLDAVWQHLLPLLVLPDGVSPENATTEQVLEALKKLSSTNVLDADAGANQSVSVEDRKECAVPAASNSVKKTFVQPLHNRGSASVPVNSFLSSSRTKRQREAVNNYQEKNGCSYRDAFNAVQRNNPELFMETL